MKQTRAFAPFEWMLALRYLRAKRAESFISVISMISLVGIALGVATLIIVMSVMNGFRNDLMGRILGLNGHVIIQNYGGGGLANYDGIVARVKKVPGVVSVAPLVQGFVAVDANGVAIGAQIRGMRKSDLYDQQMVSSTLSRNALTLFDQDSVIVGVRLAQSMGLAPGGDLKVMGLHGDVTPFGTTPRV